MTAYPGVDVVGATGEFDIVYESLVRRPIYSDRESVLLQVAQRSTPARPMRD